MKPKLTYDAKDNATYVQFSRRPVVANEQYEVAAGGLKVDLDGQGRIVGVEVQHHESYPKERK